MATTVVMPSPRQREDVYEAFTRLSESCDNFDRDAAITACKDGIRASKVILALLGGSDPDASYASSSEESFTGPGASVDSSDGEDSNGEPGGLLTLFETQPSRFVRHTRRCEAEFRVPISDAGVCETEKK